MAKISFFNLQAFAICRAMVFALAIGPSTLVASIAFGAQDQLEIQRHQPGGDDEIVYLTHPGSTLMAWEIVKEDKLVFLNYSRFPWGQDSTKWGFAPAMVCYDNVKNKNYVGIGDSLPHLRKAMEAAIRDDGGKPHCMMCGPYETRDDWGGGFALPDLKNGLPLGSCAAETPVS